jgi:hypothetical protein
MTGQTPTEVQALEPGPLGDTELARLRLAQDVAGIGTWDWDLVTGELDWDEQCAALFGLDLAEAPRTIDGFNALAHPDDLELVHAVLQDAIDTAGSVQVAFRALLPDGTVRHLLSRGQALVGQSGRAERLLGAILDVTDLRAASEAKSRLASVALRLAQTETVADVNTVLVEEGFAALGAAGGGVMLRSPDGGSVQVTLSSAYGEEIQSEISVLPIDLDLPAVHTARTGEPLFFRDYASMVADFPGQAELLRRAGVEAAACLPLTVAGRLLGSLTATWAEPRAFRPDEVELVGALAAQCGSALDRVAAREVERRAAAEARSMSEALQRSLLTSPPEPDHSQIAVRYHPAHEQAQVGGDWYDAFITPDGATSVVIGDVTGHDRNAAAAMGQIRNLLRATSYVLLEPPAAVLNALDRTMAGLQVDALATCVLVRVEQSEEQARRGVRLVRWCNAGHLPPLLHEADGTTSVLDSAPELLLGLDPDAGREDQAREIAPGSTLLLYTDGLVERRGEGVDEGVERLRLALDELGHLPLEEVCDRLLERLLPDDAEDDVALVAVRFHDESRPRPIEAGPERVPEDIPPVPR